LYCVRSCYPDEIVFSVEHVALVFDPVVQIENLHILTKKE
jgi:hypothetical protein